MIKKKTADGNSKAKNSKRKKRMPKTVQEFIGMTLDVLQVKVSLFQTTIHILSCILSLMQTF